MEAGLKNTILAASLAAPDTTHDILNVWCHFYCEQDPRLLLSRPFLQPSPVPLGIIPALKQIPV